MFKRMLAAAATIPLAACATEELAVEYNTTGPTGALVRQEVGFDSYVCYYDSGLVIYTQGNCPPSVRSNVFTR